jgi:hypothetical protein
MMMISNSGITHYQLLPRNLSAPRTARLAGSQSRSVASSDLVRLRLSGVVVVVAGESGGSEWWS